MDTLANESMNNTISWVAPKNKVYCGTSSLAVRIAIAVGINSLGTMRFYNELFRLLGIQMTDDVAHWLQVKDSNRAKRLSKCKTTDFKKKRKLQFYNKLKNEVNLAKDERKSRDGVYKSGIGMNGGYAADDTNGDKKMPAVPAEIHNQQERDPTIDYTKLCSACNKPGHSRRSSKLCDHYSGGRTSRKRSNKSSTPPSVAASLPTDNPDADELDQIDAMPLQDSSSTDGSADFFDARDYCSSDSEEGTNGETSAIV